MEGPWTVRPQSGGARLGTQSISMCTAGRKFGRQAVSILPAVPCKDVTEVSVSALRRHIRGGAGVEVLSEHGCRRNELLCRQRTSSACSQTYPASAGSHLLQSIAWALWCLIQRAAPAWKERLGAAAAPTCWAIADSLTPSASRAEGCRYCSSAADRLSTSFPAATPSASPPGPKPVHSGVQEQQRTYRSHVGSHLRAAVTAASTRPVALDTRSLKPEATGWCMTQRSCLRPTKALTRRAHPPIPFAAVLLLLHSTGRLRRAITLHPPYQKHPTHRNRKVQDTPQQRGRTTRHELARAHRHGERVTRIYPREITKSPPSAQRFASASPPIHYNASTSPLFSAIGATRTAAQYTTEWTKSLPFFGSQASPGNGGIAIAGSPPTFQNSPGARDGLYMPGMSNSPPTAGGRPLSHPNQQATFGGRDRRPSTYSQYTGRPLSQNFAGNPPLPHQPQAHFYGAPELDLGLDGLQETGVLPGEGGYFCGFDTLSMAGDEAARVTENVLLVGSQGGLDVFRVERGKLDIIGHLDGLRGGVIGAKILPWSSRRDPFASSRPLIALTLHGPVLKEGRSSQSGSGSSSVIDDSASESPSRPRSNDSSMQVSGYQTTVEIYSLKEQRKLATLYTSPLVPLVTPVGSPLFQPPAPVGELVVDANGKFVVVASGTSGEIFVYAPYVKGHREHAERFRCVGKIWTSVQLRERTVPSSGSSGADGSHEDVPPEKYGVPVFSLSDRWLAVTPPTSSSSYSVNGTALTSQYYERPPGTAHPTAPTQPSINCAVDAPEVASLLNRLTREGTQVAIQGALWATEKSMQAFKNYMNKGTANSLPYQDPMQHYFPPTHGHNQAQPRQEASVVAIHDLQKLVEAEETRSKGALQPISVFPATNGCSFLSFSPTGLMLMTISTKGDCQEVWDLKRVNFRRARKTNREQALGPHVRQVAKFTRITVTNVIDVVWSAPRIDKVAVITDKGTVHMFLMPASASQWPPPRRIRPAGAAKSTDDAAPVNTGGAVGSAMHAAKPFINAVRGRAPSNGSRFTFSSLGMTPAAGAKSSKAVAAGVGNSINSIRRSGDNKLTLPVSASGVKPHSARWLSGKGRGSIGLVSGGVLQIWRVQMRPANGKGKAPNATSISKRKVVEFGLAAIPDTPFPPSVTEQLYPQAGDQEGTNNVYGEWLPRALPNKPATHGAKKAVPALAPLSFSEIETNPPYQPFYTDRRVTRFVYSRPLASVHESGSEHQSPTPSLASTLHHEDDTSPWLFGEDVDAIRISSPATHAHDVDEDDFAAGVAARIENKLVLNDDEEQVEQVVVTTRRRRVKREGEEGEEGFFEDDCEVLDFAEDRV
ncbi:hypothetical protein C7974DRAFT_473860 [Boeremia exigua]|uniref:uncharacterized protein n=1 Tax=Boeremia exigua TaxID=749465 RepID=UPI001E8DF236|nr:uncharacterized protein C7974DRAFT_473860 [Boeremia exigua]KAH6620025.1 hypothetical protein C7974DRAFT_473860 [Boeremia exigua]